MKFSGKQIRVTLATGELKVFRGSSYALRLIESGVDKKWNEVEIFLNGSSHVRWLWSEVSEVVEDQFGSEVLV